MKIEICENTFWLALWAIVLSAVAAVAIVITVSYNTRTIAAFNAGYQETPMTGSNQIIWTKK